MITFRDFGKIGNLGNQLFQYASLLGISRELNKKLSLPEWKYSYYFDSTFPIEEPNTILQLPTIRESKFEYNPDNWNVDYDFNVHGYLQSEKYFSNNIKEIFKFKKYYTIKVFERYKEAFNKTTIAISIRRGDYVDNPNYELLPITYYIKALFELDYTNCNILIFSDDIEYCKVHFQCLDNVYFVDDLNDIGQLMLGTFCNHFIIANSTFSWWMAYLGEKVDSRIIRPNYLFNGKLLEINDDKDFWPDGWEVYDHKVDKLNLKDTTIVIPVKYDHPDRKGNLDLVIKNLQQDFDVNIFIGEQGIQGFRYTKDLGIRYYYFNNMHDFHRTRMLNYMINTSSTDIVVNYDADVLIPPLQFYLAIQAIREDKCDIIYPYDGRFNRMKRNIWYNSLIKYLDIGILKDTIFTYKHNNKFSVGGCIIYNKHKFIESGMENEEFISFGHEDSERFYRFTTLNYRVSRMKGCLYHLDHFISIDSSPTNPHWLNNKTLWLKIKEMNKIELLKYIKEKFIWKI